jgi:hypothetical protein
LIGTYYYPIVVLVVAVGVVERSSVGNLEMECDEEDGAQFIEKIQSPKGL